MSHVDEGALHAYLDGELAPAERAALEAHFAGCPACRARVAEERALVQRASHLLGLAQPAERPAPPLHQLRQPRLVRRWRVPLAWAASVMLALSVGYYMRGSPQDDAQSPAPTSIVIADDRAAASVAEEKPAPAPGVAPPVTRRAQVNQATRRDADDSNQIEQLGLRAQPPAAGVVSSDLSPRLRDAAARPDALSRQPPVPAANAAESDARVVTGAAAARGRLVATEWPIIRREPARAMLGSDPVGVPGLAVREIRSSPSGDGIVLVEQQLDSSTVIQLFQRPATAERAEVRAQQLQRSAAPAAASKQYAAMDRLARFVGGLRVEIAGPLSQDSLNRLLEQVKPLP